MPTLKPDGKRLCGKGSKWIQPKRRRAIYERDNWECQWCGKGLRDVHHSMRTLDHIVPRRLGGGHGNENLLTACAACNFSRNVPRRERDALRCRAGRKFSGIAAVLQWAENLHGPRTPPERDAVDFMATVGAALAEPIDINALLGLTPEGSPIGDPR